MEIILPALKKTKSGTGWGAGWAKNAYRPKTHLTSWQPIFRSLSQLPVAVSCHCLNWPPWFPVTASIASLGLQSLPQLLDSVYSHCLNCQSRFPVTAITPFIASTAPTVSCHCLNCQPRSTVTASTTSLSLQSLPQLPASVHIHCLNYQPWFTVTASTTSLGSQSLPQLPATVSCHCPAHHDFLPLPQLPATISCHCLNCQPRLHATASTARLGTVTVPTASLGLQSLPQLPVVISCHCLNWPQWLPVILLPQLPA